jgi:hypothetical protein
MDDQRTDREGGQLRIRQLIIAVLLFVTVGVACGASYFLGLLRGSGGIYHARYIEERKYVEKRLSGKSEFSKVIIEERSNGGVSLAGEVASEKDRQSLRSELSLAIGEPRSKEAMIAVEVKP